MMRILLILCLIAIAGGPAADPRPMPTDPGADKVLDDPEWVEFLGNMEMLEDYGELLDVEASERDDAKPPESRGVNSGGDGSDRNTE